MPLNDLLHKIRQQPHVKDDFIKTLVDFAKRHDVHDVSPNDFQVSAANEEVPGPPGVVIYRDGPHRSRWIDSN